jgi:hypothetical protein
MYKTNVCPHCNYNITNQHDIENQNRIRKQEEECCNKIKYYCFIIILGGMCFYILSFLVIFIIDSNYEYEYKKNYLNLDGSY